MAIFEKIGTTTQYQATKIGEVEATLKLGGNTEKCVPNANMSWECFSGKEKYFLNLNRKDQIITIEKETLNLTKQQLELIDNVWHFADEKTFKWDVRFDSKPKSNVVEFEVLCSPEINFYYQDTLENEYGAFKDPQFTLEEYLKNAFRPDNVIGSYAVYCDKRDNRSDAKYFTGKLAHIYRPLCIDALGNKEWADLYIDHFVLWITIPQKFLDTAVYPVTLDPNIGYSTKGGGSYSPGNLGVACHGTTDASGGNTAQVHAWGGIEPGYGNDTIRLAVYTDDVGNNRPEQQLLAEVSQLVLEGMNQQVDINYVVTLAANTKFWVAFSWASYGKCYYDSGASNIQSYHTMAAPPDLPATWPNSTTNSSSVYSVWADYAAAGGRATKNTASNQLGQAYGMNFGIPR